MEIYLIRHTSIDVPAGYAYGFTDVPLKPTFEQEAEVVKSKLKGIEFDKVYTSPLSRAHKLATYCGFPEAIKEDRVKELNFGEWEMKPWQELTEDTRSTEWFADWVNYPAPGGESFVQQYERVAAFLDEIRNSGCKRVAIFAHGGVVTCARVYAKQYEFKEAFNNIPSYGEVVKLTF